MACTPASGWEKGQVENQVGLVRERFFTPRLRFKTYDEMNAWLLDSASPTPRPIPIPSCADKTVWEVFEGERPNLVAYRGRFDGFHAVPASVSKTCLVRFDNNKYSVMASAVGRPVEVHAYADRIVIRQDGEVVGEHPRRFGRGETIYDPWHYVPVLARKPGALRNGAPFKDWVLPARWSACARSSPAPTTATGRWSRFSPPCSPTDCRRWRRPAPRRWPKASIRPTSSSTFWPGAAIPPGRDHPDARGAEAPHAPVADCDRYDQLEEGV